MPPVPKKKSPSVEVFHADCLEHLPRMPDASIDAVVCDPPYPEIAREYGRLTEAEWWSLVVEGVVPQVRRILKPTGSAVFILQPNSRKVGSMRGWLWEFMAWCCREWNVVQDVWWWNTSSPPTIHCNRTRGLMRPSLKAMVWAGDVGCYRNQDAILIEPAEATKTDRRINQMENRIHPSGHHGRMGRQLATCVERGGATPFNVTMVSPGDAHNSAGAHGHGAGTPLLLMQWWVRYVCPPGGTVLDPFAGSGTLGVACLREKRSAVLVEKHAPYVEIIHKRISEELSRP